MSLFIENLQTVLFIMDQLPTIFLITSLLIKLHDDEDHIDYYLIHQIIVTICFGGSF